METETEITTNIENTETAKEKDQVGIGTKDTETLSAKPITVVGHRIEDVMKEEKKIGEKVVLISKHPDREDNIEISQVKYLKGDKLTSSGMWYNLDADKMIPKQSALAEAMRKYECNMIADFDGKTIATDLDGKYLVIKAY